jgi:ribosomal protein L37AE/L43A
VSAKQQQLDSGVDGDTTEACPHCDSARSVEKRQTKELPWKCFECGETFEEPTRRPSRFVRGLTHSARFLWEADAEDWP